MVFGSHLSGLSIVCINYTIIYNDGSFVPNNDGSFVPPSLTLLSLSLSLSLSLAISQSLLDCQ